MGKHEHTFTMGVVVVSNERDPNKIDSNCILGAIQKRTDYLTDRPEEVLDAVEPCFSCAAPDDAVIPECMVRTEAAIEDTTDYSTIRVSGKQLDRLDRRSLMNCVAKLHSENEDLCKFMSEVRLLIHNVEHANVGEFGQTGDLKVAQVIDSFKKSHLNQLL